MIKLGIIGAGGMANYQAKRFGEINTCQLWACKDQRIEHAKSFAKKYCIDHWYTELDTLLSDPEGSCDAYSCAVLDEGHAYIGQRILSIEKPLMIEKPLARTLREAELLANLAEQKKVPNFVNFSKRNAPALWALKNLIKNNYLGFLYTVKAEYTQGWVATNCWGDWMTTPRWRWRLQPQTSTAGIIGDLGSHLVDTLLLLFGTLIPDNPPQLIRLDEAIQSKQAPYQNLENSFYDEQGTVPVEASVDFHVTNPEGKKIAGTMRLSWLDSESTDVFKILITGEKGSALLDLSQSKNQVFIYDLNHHIDEIINYPMVPSTYEAFIKNAEGTPIESTMKNQKNTGEIPNFYQGCLVQKTLNELFPGVLPE